MNIIFSDLNASLVKKMKEANRYAPWKKHLQIFEGDIFQHEGVITSASNPSFTMGGGLDAKIRQLYPNQVNQIHIQSGNQRVENCIFTVTVDEQIQSSRTLVQKALEFAYANINDDETLLLTGLGTAIGGLHEDDFVWLFLQETAKKFGYGYGFKYTQTNGYDHRTGTILYKTGKKLEQKNAPKDGEECGVGLHLGKDFKGCGNYHTPGRIFLCTYDKKHFCGEGDDKIRVSELKVVAQLPQWLGYGQKGFRIADKIYKLNIGTYDITQHNPYTATNLPSATKLKPYIDQVRDQVRAQVWAQVWDQVRDQV